VIGGFLAIAATAFLFPYIDSLTPLVIIIAVVAFVSAWIAGGRRFGYTGAQLAFSFYLVAFEGFSAPTQLAPARDRLIGILLALVVMWFVFDQMWPVRTVVVMRKTLAHILHEEAEFLRMSQTTTDRYVQLRKADALRDQIGKNVAGLRTLNDAVVYEFGVNRDEHRRSSEIIVATALKAVSIFWNQLVILHRDEDRDFLEEKRLADMRQRLAERIDIMADAVARKTTFEPAAQLVDPEVLSSPRFGEYASNSTARFFELQAMVVDLNQQPV
jgi:multidrug resistance protein MdtO